MAAITSGVYPVFKNQFKISTAGRVETPTFVVIKDCETFSVSIDGNVEEWTPFDTEGWIRRLKTGMSLSLSITGKRNIGDPGNDYIASKMLATGQDACSILQWTFPDGAVLLIPCIVNVKNIGGGDSKNVAPLEFDTLSDGTPTYTPVAAG